MVESKNELTKLIGSQLFFHNGSFLFNSMSTFRMPGNLITIPTLTSFRIFSIRNLQVCNNFEHLITNSNFRQNFQLNIINCRFSKFLKSPISITFETQCNQNKTYFENLTTSSIRDTCFEECRTDGPNGGALEFVGNSTIEINNCSFTNCSSHDHGGAVYIRNFETCEIKYCNFIQCNVTSRSSSGGSLYLENITKSVLLDTTTFKNCYSNFAGSGAFILNSDLVQIKNVLFDQCICTNEVISFGAGAAILNSSILNLKNIKATYCNSIYGSGLSVNVFYKELKNYPLYQYTNITGQFLYGDNCTSLFGNYAFHFCNFVNLYYLNFTDLICHDGKANLLIFISSCEGIINNTYVNNINNTNYGIFYFYNFACTTNEPLVLSFDCVVAPNTPDGTALLFFDNRGCNRAMIINIKYSIDYLVDPFTFDSFIHASLLSNNECHLVTPSLIFTNSEEFTHSHIFTYSNVFTDSHAFTASFDFYPTSAFTKSNTFSETSFFSESFYFTRSSQFSSSIIFTESKYFTQSKDFTQSIAYSSTFEQTSVFTMSNAFSNSLNFSSSEYWRTPINNPEMTLYNMGASNKDGKGTKTDQGFVFIYVIVALIAVLLIATITFAICKAQKPIIEDSVTPEVRDEFFFPDFENEKN